MKIPHSRPTITKKDIQQVARALASGQLSQGRIVEQFEKRLSRKIKQPYGVAVSSGTAALHLLFAAHGIKDNDEVIMPSYGCVALYNAASYCGANVVLADVRENDFHIDTQSVRKKLTRKTKLIIVPHLFGFCAPVQELKSCGIPVVEDIAQNIGAEINGKPCGGFGDFAVCSFYATKMLTTGEGGMVFGKNKKVIERIRDLRDYDQKKTFKIRYNYKMTDFQAALGLSQLSQLPHFIKNRRKLARIYAEAFSSCRHVAIQHAEEGTKPVFYRFVLRVKTHLSRFDAHAKKAGIECKKPVHSPLHPYLKNSSTYPVSERLYRLLRSVPIYPSLHEKTARDIAWRLKEAFPS